jgi:hypothetical protein
MCRSIKRLYDTESAVTEEELHEAALQFVRKISGFRKPSRANQAAFEAAVEEIADTSARLIASLQSPARARTPAASGNKA